MCRYINAGAKKNERWRKKTVSGRWEQMYNEQKELFFDRFQQQSNHSCHIDAHPLSHTHTLNHESYICLGTRNSKNNQLQTKKHSPTDTQKLYAYDTFVWSSNFSYEFCLFGRRFLLESWINRICGFHFHLCHTNSIRWRRVFLFRSLSMEVRKNVTHTPWFAYKINVHSQKRGWAWMLFSSRQPSRHPVAELVHALYARTTANK